MNDAALAPLTDAARARPQRQQQWLQALLAGGLPGTRREAWKYTDPAPLLRLLQTPADATPAADPLDGLGDAPLRLVIVDGEVDQQLSRLDHLPPGALRTTDVREPALDSIPAILAASLAPAGVQLAVPAATHVDEPLQVVVVANRAAGPVGAAQLTVTLGEGAHLDIELILRGDGLHALALDSDLAAGARLQLARDQACTETAVVLESMQARIGAGAVLAQTHVDSGTRLTRRESELTLAGDDARLDYDMLTCLKGRQHVDHHIHVRHELPNGSSRINARGLLGGTSRGVVTGRVEVAPGAIGTDSAQMARSLLLADTAEANVRPELEIYADDVKCAHGATIGQMDETALFYLRTRGLDATTARSLLMHSFAADIINTIANTGVRERLTAQLDLRLDQLVGAPDES